MKKLHFISLGCPKNLVDSEVMLGHLNEDGFTLVSDAKEAQIIVVNTCAFIEDAKKEAIDTILEMGGYKKKGQCRLLVVAGCLPQRYKDEIAELLPEVDIFIGAGEVPRIAEIIREHERAQGIHIGSPDYLYDHASPRMHITPRHVAYLKIAEGCFHPCSFCVIPKIRGKFRSRPIGSIVKEAEAMLEKGVKEINLIAQDTTSYGSDLGLSLSLLLEKLSAIRREKWLRVLYSYPHNFPMSLINAMREYSGVCRYLDVPIQHISDKVLKSMRRPGGSDEIRRLIDRLRTALPGIWLRTSLIVGYPGETDEDFDELLDFVCEAKFEHLGVFIYSPEEGTPAAKLKKRVPRDVAEARQNEIMNIQREVSYGKNQKMVGKRIRVLVEGVSEESNILLQARHEGQAPEIDGVVYISEGLAAAGDFATVEIVDAHDYDLVGRIR